MRSLLAIVLLSSASLVGCFAPTENVEETSGAAITGGESYRSPRGRTLRVRNTHSLVLQRVIVLQSTAFSERPPGNTLRGFVAPGGTGTFRVADSAAFDDCQLYIRFEFSSGDPLFRSVNGCTLPSTFDGPNEPAPAWRPSSDSDDKSGSSKDDDSAPPSDEWGDGKGEG
jgi:hypothetical protein